jgi:hypothetical protein
MKPRDAAALALVLLASCAPDMVTIDAATKRSEAAANRAEKSAEIAEQAASHSYDASVRALGLAETAEKSKKRQRIQFQERNTLTPNLCSGTLTIPSTTSPCCVLLCSGRSSA